MLVIQELEKTEQQARELEDNRPLERSTLSLNCGESY